MNLTEAPFTPDPSALGWLKHRTTNVSVAPVKQAFDAALAALESASAQIAAEDRPFLTVVMRTQGRKPEAFQDALLTLFGQTNQDFELLILPHEVSADTLADIERVVALQATGFRERIRVIPVEGGGRSHPLNVAVEAGTGRYFAFFDDDDLVFGHWVESFARAADVAPGQLLRSVAATQLLRHEKWNAGVEGYRTTNWPQASYPETFKFETHLEQNQTPFMAIAFPRELFHVWGERFDDSLNVCEDWDMILRGSSLLGVTSVTELTTIYRLWQGITSSYSEHDVASWRASEARVREKLNAAPILLQTKGSESLIGSLQEKVVVQRDDSVIHALTHSTSWKITAPLRKAARVIKTGVRKIRNP